MGYYWFIYQSRHFLYLRDPYYNSTHVLTSSFSSISRNNYLINIPFITIEQHGYNQFVGYAL
jgi:hypothetical protein